MINYFSAGLNVDISDEEFGLDLLGPNQGNAGGGHPRRLAAVPADLDKILQEISDKKKLQNESK